MNAWKNAFVLSLVLFMVMFVILCLGLSTTYPTKTLLTDMVCVFGAFGVTLYTGTKWLLGSEKQNPR